ncbi:ABC transporter substrate-binding protein [Kibdelosporangium aridum]|uniref:Peptide/nickel transport system substrate-binding protein n=1 Tax=Kibdelosporangium aridum TaxID=2030 RepID=A0A1W2BLF2_KIBAR|nr:ABC transporter substrate-binding protein [Kibdelosporangium aridum]SMC73767.1 peptide/nickel transport system substrate-binding protein [Kibdelosporangium aridum]
MITRRNLLLAAATVPLLSSCDSTASTATKSGGTLRAAFIGGGATETLNLFRGGTTLDFVRARAMHGTIGDIDPSAPDGVRYGVVERIDSAPDFSTYTLKVRPGVKFTDGSTVTARDIAFSLNLLATSQAGGYAAFVSDFDLTAAKATDDLTLVLPTKRPIADGRQILCLGASFVVKDGAKEITKDTPTCGPFRLTAFEPGRGSTLVRNDQFYGRAPQLDGLELLSIADNAARLNAVRGGQADFAFDLDATLVRTIDGDPRLAVRQTSAPSLSALYFSMNIASPPFDNPKVREAFKLAVNRQTIVDTAVSGRGQIGNDLFGFGYADYATDIPQRAYDPDRARALLREAGADGFSVALTTGPEAGGLVEAATLVVEQLNQVGVKATLDQKPAGQLFADLNAYVRLPFASAYSTPTPPTLYYQLSYAGGAPFGLGWNRPDVDALMLKARTSASADERRAAAIQAQQVLWAEGNAIVPVLKPYLNVSVSNLVGVEKGLLESYPSFAEASFQ